MKRLNKLKLIITLPFIVACSPTSPGDSLTTNTVENPSSDPTISNPSTSEPTTGTTTLPNTSTTDPGISFPELPEIDYVQVFAPVEYINVYAWDDSSGSVREILGGWPGKTLQNFNENWKTYAFEGETSLKFIFNKGNGGEQTADLSAPKPGYYWYYNGEVYDDVPGSNPNTPSTPINPDEVSIQVFAPIEYSNIYAWDDSNGSVREILGGWPGKTLQNFDENWKTYAFENETSLKFIFSKENGEGQTGDLSAPKPGNYWYLNGNVYTEEPDPNNPPAPGPVVECESWKDFKFWDEYPEDYWKINNSYTGTRDDFRNETIYFAITTRFYDGDTGNNVHCWDGSNPDSDPAWRGDFKGLIEKMDYIKALGFTTIWITPVVENCSGYDYHGYHAMDHSKVDPRYLSEDIDFQTVINEAHKRDMKICLDVVFNHTGNFGETNLMPFFYKEGDLSSSDCLKMHEDSVLPSNYFNLNGTQQYDERIAAMKNTRNNGSDPNYIYHHYGNFSWESFGEQVAQIAGDCVDLNTENPIVVEYLVRCYGNFIKMGVDAFRTDTMKHISRLTFNNYITPALYEFAKKCGNDNFFMFGEVCTRVREVWNRGIPALSAPFYTWKEEKEYPWGDVYTNLESIETAYNDNNSVNNERTSTNAMLDGINYHTPDYSAANGMGVIDFPMHWNWQYAQDAFRTAVSGDKYYNDSTYNVMYVDSHDYGPDTISTVRYNMGTAAWAENLSLMFTFRGIPCLYYGSEIEFQKGKTIDQGPYLKLSETGRAYYGDHLLGSVTASDFGTYTASGNVKSTLESTLAKHIIKLNKIRQAIPALRMGQYTTNNCEGEMSFIRRYTNDEIDSLALVTVSGEATFKNIPNGKYIDAVTGEIINVSNGTLSVPDMGQGNLRVYVCCSGNFTGISGVIGDTGLAYLK